jgi:hypothetical protein
VRLEILLKTDKVSLAVEALKDGKIRVNAKPRARDTDSKIVLS